MKVTIENAKTNDERLVIAMEPTDALALKNTLWHVYTGQPADLFDWLRTEDLLENLLLIVEDYNALGTLRRIRGILKENGLD